jgi:hypothetical protein
MSKKEQVNIRISESVKRQIGKIQGGPTAVFWLGFHTIKMYIQDSTLSTCTYIFKTGNRAAPPAHGSRTLATHPAQGRCCPACPLHSTFGHRAASTKSLEQRMMDADQWSEQTFGLF